MGNKSNNKEGIILKIKKFLARLGIIGVASVASLTAGCEREPSEEGINTENTEDTKRKSFLDGLGVTVEGEEERTGNDDIEEEEEHEPTIYEFVDNDGLIILDEIIDVYNQKLEPDKQITLDDIGLIEQGETVGQILRNNDDEYFRKPMTVKEAENNGLVHADGEISEALYLVDISNGNIITSVGIKEGSFVEDDEQYCQIIPETLEVGDTVYKNNDTFVKIENLKTTNRGQMWYIFENVARFRNAKLGKNVIKNDGYTR